MEVETPFIYFASFMLYGFTFFLVWDLVFIPFKIAIKTLAKVLKV